MNNNQTVNLYGNIDKGVSEEWSGNFNGEEKLTNNKFIHYENSDGLNYMRIELSRYHELISVGENKWFRINTQLGLSTGFFVVF